MPLVPVIVTVKLPVLVEAVVVTVMVDEPEPVSVAGLKLAVAPAGRPLAPKVTLLLNPPIDVMVAVYEMLLPCVTVCEDGEAAMVKSGVSAALTVNTSAAMIPIRPCVEAEVELFAPEVASCPSVANA